MPKLTKTIIDAARVPEKGDAFLWDTELPGFGVRIKFSGRKTYVVRYRNQYGHQRKMALGRCCDMPPDRARDVARKVFAQVIEGKDPAAERAAQRRSDAPSGVTVEALFKGYVAWMRSRGKDSAKEVERMLLTSKRHAAADFLGRNRRPSEVKSEDVIGYVQTYYRRGKRGAADKARSYIASAYQWGIKSENDYTVEHRQNWGIKMNPAAVLAKDPAARRVRDRNLSRIELRALWDATFDREHFHEDIGACIRVLIACGQRVQETLRLDGREVDFEARLWKMPAEKTKGGKHPHTVPLPAVILPTLKELIGRHGEGPLFPGRKGRRNERMEHQTIQHAIARWLRRAGVEMEHFQTRDLRRTWKSRTADAGIDRFTRDLIQQHAKSDTGSKNYDRADYLPQMREAMNKWSKWLGIVLSGGTPPEYGQPLLREVA